MNPDNGVQASFWVMVVLQTIGSVDPIPGGGSRKLPAPGVYVPVILTWSVLQLIADAGFEHGARVAGWVMTLTGAVVGPFGQKAVHLFSTVAKLYSPKGTIPTGTGASTTVAPPSTTQA